MPIDPAEFTDAELPSQIQTALSRLQALRADHQRRKIEERVRRLQVPIIYREDVIAALRKLEFATVGQVAEKMGTTDKRTVSLRLLSGLRSGVLIRHGETYSVR